MKEIRIELGKAKLIKNQYLNKVLVGHNNKGYYIIEDKKRFGPFFKVFLDVSDKHNNDIFLVGYNHEKSYIYRVGINGLELSDAIDTSQELRRILLDKIDISNHEEFKDCIYFGKIDEYALFADKNNIFFVVNVLDDVMPIESYPKFDSYKELTKWYRKNKGIKLFSTYMNGLTCNSEYIRLDSITEAVSNLDLEDLNKKMQDRIKSLVPIDYVNTIELDSFYDATKRHVDLKYIPKFRLDDKIKEDLQKEGYVRFNFRSIGMFREKYLDKFILFKREVKTKYEELQREYILSNFKIRELFKNFEPVHYANSTFNYKYRIIFDNEFNDKILYRILMYVGLQDFKIKQLEKISPEVYHNVKCFCRDNFVKIKKMIVEQRLEYLRSEIQILNEKIKNIEKFDKVYDSKERKIKIENELKEFERILIEINSELPNVSTDTGVEW